MTDKETKTMTSEEIKAVLGKKHASYGANEPLASAKEEHITPHGRSLEEDGISTTAMKFKTALAELVGAKSSGRICEGVVTSAIPGNAIDGLDAGQFKDMMFANVLYQGHVSVLIPAPFFIAESMLPKRKLTDIKEKNRRDGYFITDRAGAKVDFVVRDIIEKEEESFVIGDRVAAMKELRKDNYFDKGNIPAYIREGKAYNARIMFVQNNKMGVELGGYETILDNRDVTYKYLASLKDEKEYVSGNYIPLKVNKVLVKGEGEDMDVDKVQLDGKSIGGMDERDIAMKNLPVGSVFTGIVTQIMPDGNYHVRHKDNDWYVRCDAPRFVKPEDMPMRLDMVRVRVTKQDPAKKMIYAQFKSLHGNRN